MPSSVWSQQLPAGLERCQPKPAATAAQLAAPLLGLYPCCAVAAGSQQHPSAQGMRRLEHVPEAGESLAAADWPEAACPTV